MFPIGKRGLASRLGKWDNEGMNGDKQHRKQHKAPWLKKYEWKPGESGNQLGRTPGKTVKEWAREFLKSLPDKEKLEFLKEISPDIVWKMAEGNPADEMVIGQIPELPFIINIQKDEPKGENS